MAAACVGGATVNRLNSEPLGAAIDRVRADDDFAARAKQLIERDQELLERLAQ